MILPEKLQKLLSSPDKVCDVFLQGVKEQLEIKNQNNRLNLVDASLEKIKTVITNLGVSEKLITSLVRFEGNEILLRDIHEQPFINLCKKAIRVSKDILNQYINVCILWELAPVKCNTYQPGPGITVVYPNHCIIPYNLFNDMQEFKDNPQVWALSHRIPSKVISNRINSKTGQKEVCIWLYINEITISIHGHLYATDLITYNKILKNRDKFLTMRRAVDRGYQLSEHEQIKRMAFYSAKSSVLLEKSQLPYNRFSMSLPAELAGEVLNSAMFKLFSEINRTRLEIHQKVKKENSLLIAHLKLLVKELHYFRMSLAKHIKAAKKALLEKVQQSLKAGQNNWLFPKEYGGIPIDGVIHFKNQKPSVSSHFPYFHPPNITT